MLLETLPLSLSMEYGRVLSLHCLFAVVCGRLEHPTTAVRNCDQQDDHHQIFQDPIQKLILNFKYLILIGVSSLIFFPDIKVSTKQLTCIILSPVEQQFVHRVLYICTSSPQFNDQLSQDQSVSCQVPRASHLSSMERGSNARSSKIQCLGFTCL